mgnify:CR=1 FL=1
MPDILDVRNIILHIENASFFGCIDGLYDCFFTPNDNDEIVSRNVPMIMRRPSLIIFILKNILTLLIT